MKRFVLVGASVLTVAAAPVCAQVVQENTVVKKSGGGAAAGAVTGAATGAAVGGPVGAAVGAVAGAVLGGAATPPAEVRTYVTGQTVAPAAYAGPVVVGKPITGDVTWLEVPDYPKYRWAYLGERRVVVDADSRNVVAVYAADPPAAVRTYVTGRTGATVTYGQPLVVGGVVRGDVSWLDVPDYPRYRWAYLDGRRVVVDADTGTVVAIY